jgi:RNA polymerase sigma-70 factor (ECF subfamily)
MDAQDCARLEAGIAAALSARDLDRAMTLAIHGYGPEVLGFLHGRSGDPSLVEDAFSLLCEQIWKALPNFTPRVSFRAWMYALARTSAAQVRRGEVRRARRNRPLLSHEEIAERVRSTTLPYLQTAVKGRLAALRDALPPEDRDLLILRVDRQIEWNEIAHILSDGAAPGAEETRREAARLRKRFQLLKERLRDQAQREGLLRTGDE